MNNPQKANSEILRALNLHAELLALILTGQATIVAKLDALAKVQRELLRATGTSDSKMEALFSKTFDATLAKLENGVRESVAEIQKNLPTVEEPEENRNN